MHKHICFVVFSLSTVIEHECGADMIMWNPTMPIKWAPATNRITQSIQAMKNLCGMWIQQSYHVAYQARKIWKDCVIILESWLVLSVWLDNSTNNSSLDLIVRLLQFFT